MNACLMLAALMALTPVSAEKPVAASPQDMILFTDGFEGDMSQWIGQGGGAHSGVIVPDPLNPANHVLTFTALADGGDIFSAQYPAYHGFVFLLSFDYLGLPKEGTPDANTGGKVGVTQDTPGSPSFWEDATVDEPCIWEELIDDGTWHSYMIPFFPECVPEFKAGGFRVMLEDWCGRPPDMPQGVPGDAFFDNVQLYIHEVGVQESSWGAIKAIFR